MVNLDVLYYSGKELIRNSALYYPSVKKNDNPLDIYYLQQKIVKMLEFFMHLIILEVIIMTE